MSEHELTVAEARALKWLALGERQDMNESCNCRVCDWLRRQRVDDAEVVAARRARP